ncbi:hypothetical protein Tco_1268753, partial [Tanacetum coccineum]
MLSINGEEERCVLISIEECLIQDDPNILKYFSKYSCNNDNFLLRIDSRFPVGYYKADKMNFKLRIRTPLFLSPDITYGLNLVFHYCDSEIEKMKQQYVGLCQFNSTKECISDFEILLESCGFSGDLYIEGIEFQPLKNVERPVAVANKEIVRAVASPLFYGFTKEPEVLFSQGVLLNKGKMVIT